MSDESKIISSFTLQETLNPIIWDNYEVPEKASLKVEIRKKLLEIAHEFMDFIEVDFFVDDIIVTGSLSNFNWSEYSDIDLHLEVDFTQFDDDSVELYRELFNLKKLLFNTNHDITIHGFETELYVQDILEEHTSGGIYSIVYDKWLTIPSKTELSINRDVLKKKIRSWTKKIDDLIEQSEDLDFDESIELVKNLRDKLKKYRKSGLESGGEYSYENLVFKYLRRSKYIEKLFEFAQKLKDKKLSLESLNENVDKNEKLKELIFQYFDTVTKGCVVYKHENNIWIINPKTKYWYVTVGTEICWIRYQVLNELTIMFNSGIADVREIMGQWVKEVIINRDFGTTHFGGDLMSAVEEVIERGNVIKTLGENNSTSLKENFISPIPSTTITSNYDEQRDGYTHKGVDLQAPSGTKIVNIEDGIVIDSAIRNDACGGTLYIDHQNGFKSRYCHLKQINVKKGDKVSKNQTLGLSGGAKNDIGKGKSTGPHLHFELYKDGTTVNPMDYLSGAKTSTASNELGFFDKLMIFIFGEKIGETTKQKEFIGNLEEIINKKKEIRKLPKPTYNKDVATVQEILQLIGYSLPKWGIDGKFGSETERAIKKFQTDNNLEKTGIITPETLKILLRNLAVKEIKPEAIDNIKTTPTTTETILENGKVVMEYFINKGLTKEQAAGITGNLQVESNINPNALGDSGTSFGIAQWHKPRMKKLVDWATTENKNVYDISTQLEYLWLELTTTYKKVLAELKQARTVDQAATIFASKYERPKTTDYTKRIKYAKSFFNLDDL